MSGVFRSGEGTPHRSEGPHHGVACHAAAKSLLLHCDEATIHSKEKCCILFCYAIPLFQGLVHWTNEDPISV